MDTVKGAVTVFLILLSFAFTAHAKTETGKACMSCHNGIESIREEGSGMMAMIKVLGASHGDSEGCVICHGGNPGASDAKAAHSGSPEALKKAQGPCSDCVRLGRSD